MVHLITGPVGSGKSAELLKHYESTRTGDGFFNVRRYAEGEMIGQDIVRMSTGQAVPFSRVTGAIPDGWDEAAFYVKFSFSKSGLAFAGGIIESVIRDHAPRAFVDELGPLELQKKGLYRPFARLLQADIDIYAVCRDDCVRDIIGLFSIPEPQIAIHRINPPEYNNPE